MSEVGMSEVGMSEVGMSEVGMSEARMSEARMSEVGMSEVGMSEARMSEAGMSTDLKRRLAEAWSAAWDHGEVDALDALLRAGYVRHGSSHTQQSADDVKANILACRAGFPDLVTQVEDCLVDGDRLATRWRSEGTHSGWILGVPATGRAVSVTGATFSRIVDGQIAEEWVTWDPRQMLSALGIISLDSAEGEDVR